MPAAYHESRFYSEIRVELSIWTDAEQLGLVARSIS
jgi:hypothetical protein